PFGASIYPTPDQAAAGEPAASKPVAARPVSNEQPPRVITGPVTFEIADSAYREHRYDDATTLFRTYTESRPTNPWGFYMLGLSAWKAGDRGQADSSFVQTLSLYSAQVH